MIQRGIFCVDEYSPEGATIDIIVEGRGKIEDKALTKYYNGLRVTGMHYVTPDRLTDHISNFGFSPKKDNVFGLQVADLIAYPISRYVLFPEKHNPAFDVVEPNIYVSEGRRLGLKIFRHKPKNQCI